MGRIKVLKSKELVGSTIQDDIYPITSTQAVYDTQNHRLSAILDGINTNISTIINKLLTPEGTKPEGVKKVIVGRAISRKANVGDIYYFSDGHIKIRRSSIAIGEDGNELRDGEGNLIYEKEYEVLIKPQIKDQRALLDIWVSHPCLFIIPENWTSMYETLSRNQFEETSDIYTEIKSMAIQLDTDNKVSNFNCDTTSPYVKVIKGKLVIDKDRTPEMSSEVNIHKYAVYKLKKSRGKHNKGVLRYLFNKYNTYNPLYYDAPVLHRKDRHWQRKRKNLVLYDTQNPSNNRYSKFGIYKLYPLWRGRKAINCYKYACRIYYIKNTDTKKKELTGMYISSI